MKSHSSLEKSPILKPKKIAKRMTFRTKLAKMKKFNDLKEQDKKSMQQKIFSVLQEGKQQTENEKKEFKEKLILIK